MCGLAIESAELLRSICCDLQTAWFGMVPSHTHELCRILALALADQTGLKDVRRHSHDGTNSHISRPSSRAARLALCLPSWGPG